MSKYFSGIKNSAGTFDFNGLSLPTNKSILIPDGTVSLPSLAFSNNNDIGLYKEDVTNISTNTINPSMTAVPYIATAWSPSLSRFVTVNTSNTSLAYSDDGGITWTNGFGSDDVSDIVWSEDKSLFVSVNSDVTSGISQGKAHYSSNGISWTENSQSEFDPGFRAVTYASSLSLFVAVGNNANVMYSSTGSGSWTLIGSTPNATYNSITFSEDLTLFVAVGSGGAIKYSSTGTSGWASASAPENNLWESVVWAGSPINKFVAVSQDGTNRVMYSSTGTSGWTSASAAEQNTWRSIQWAPEVGYLMAVSSDGTNRAMYSTDGINWTSLLIGTEFWQGSLAWSSEYNRFLTVYQDNVVYIDVTLNKKFNTSINGTKKMSIDSSYVTSSVPILIPDGSSSNPSIAFSSDSNTGLYRVGSDNLGITCNATQIMDITENTVRVLANNISANVFEFRNSSNVNRWGIELSGTESGSDAGANFRINRYNDAGTYQTTPIEINRATGNISLNGYISSSGLKIDGNEFGTTLRTYTTGETDITNLVPGSTIGSILEGDELGHIVMGIRGNGSTDAFSIIHTSSWNVDGDYSNASNLFKVDGSSTNISNYLNLGSGISKASTASGVVANTTATIRNTSDNETGIVTALQSGGTSFHCWVYCRNTTSTSHAITLASASSGYSLNLVASTGALNLTTNNTAVYSILRLN